MLDTLYAEKVVGSVTLYSTELPRFQLEIPESLDDIIEKD